MRSREGPGSDSNKRVPTDARTQAEDRGPSGRAVHEHGYYVASMEDVAAAVGVAKPTLYHFFKSKHDILYAIHDEFIDLLVSEHAARVTAQPGITVEGPCAASCRPSCAPWARTGVMFATSSSAIAACGATSSWPSVPSATPIARRSLDCCNRAAPKASSFMTPQSPSLALCRVCNGAYQW